MYQQPLFQLKQKKKHCCWNYRTILIFDWLIVLPCKCWIFHSTLWWFAYSSLSAHRSSFANAIVKKSLDFRWQMCAVKSPLKNPGTKDILLIPSPTFPGAYASLNNPGFNRDNPRYVPVVRGLGLQFAYALTRKWRFAKTLWQEQSLTK